MTMNSATSNKARWLLPTAYIVLLAYGTLFPLNELDWSSTVNLSELFSVDKAMQTVSFSDLLVNFLVYLPIGLLLFINLSASVSIRSSIFLSVIFSGLISICLEYMQLFIPGRVTSFSDIAINTLGGASGAFIAFNFQDYSTIGRQLKQIRAAYTQAGSIANIGLLALFFWGLSELTPLVPSLDFGMLKQGIKPAWLTLLEPSRFNFMKALVTALNFFSIAILMSVVLRPKIALVRIFPTLIASVLFLKILVVGRQLSLEAISALLVTLPIIMAMGKASRSTLFVFPAILALLAAYIIDGLQAGDGTSLASYPLNWIPFAGQHNGIRGLVDILFNIWPFFALATLTLSVLHFNNAYRYLAMWPGAIAICLLVLAIEWYQQGIPGRYPDATDAYLATVGWLYAFFLFKQNPIQAPRTTAHIAVDETIFSMANRSILAYGAVALLVLFASSKLFSLYNVDLSIDDDTRTMLPTPGQLPPTNLPLFRYEHPRLPAPTISDIRSLRRENPAYLKKQFEKAKNGQGDFFAVAFAGLTQPYEINLNTVVNRLDKLKFSYRGHQQAMPLALSYDWLYSQLDAQQRLTLQNKLAEGCDYLINYIRRERLSPYNVFLYNRTFQALVAVSISLYGDHPKGEECMRFTYELWKNRVLPVWRQVMGKYGGWHEGSEYIGIGIGQAIYKVPAMWEHATGEDIFLNEPGISGFLDFALYRHRPDKTHVRWGDGRFFDKRIPDLKALAIKFRHKAAYSLNGCPSRFEPTAWPWGPLPDKTLCDPRATQNKPDDIFFDGLGMLIARSDWSDDATYVTFKAGNNYWSHSHLDQGSFTLFKGKALAIDSGYYGPSYGSDHHMNYSYQTIAHNVITVTDPDDTVPAPGNDKKPPRSIANDGGQRRVGSGWGESAPIDLNDWLDNKDTYQTGSIKKYLSEDDLVVAVAHLTPAYTNQDSGSGTFTARTRKIESYWRTFIYDRINDVIIIYDKVTATDKMFIKRSLLHSNERPGLTDGGFNIGVDASPSIHNSKPGQLNVSVLFPKHPYINVIGGPGAEFWVDLKNYDENGEIWKKVNKYRKNKPEPGNWRVEISPTLAREEDEFLMVLKPSLANQPTTTLEITPIDQAGGKGCAIKGSERSLRIMFPKNREGVNITYQDNGQKTLTYDLTLPGSPAKKRHWWQRIF